MGCRTGAGSHTGYPLVSPLAVVACGTQSVIDAMFGPMTSGESTYTDHLIRALCPGMILLADRGFGAGWLLTKAAAADADLPVRVTGRDRLPQLSAGVHDTSSSIKP